MAHTAIHENSRTLNNYLKRYKYQPELTRRLDALPDAAFSQGTINEIVLWKVNHYVELPAGLRKALYMLRKLRPGEHEKGKAVLKGLLACRGVDLPMASTFLRFQNSDVFQIVDRQAYRAIYGEDYPLYTTAGGDAKARLYFGYLDELLKLASSTGVEFRNLDRILYEFDRDRNGTL